MDNGTTATYTYNALGWRVEKKVGPVYTEYLFGASGDRLGENNRTTWTESYVPLGYGHYAIYQNNATYFTHPNALGSTTMVTDYDGNVVQDKLFYPWGQDWQTVGTVYDERFAKLQRRDSETGFDPTKHRTYCGGQGGWLSPDPRQGNIGDPQSFNRYAYVRNNPTGLVDPTGLDEVTPYDPWGASSTECTDVYGGGPDPEGGDFPIPIYLGTVCLTSFFPVAPVETGGSVNCGKLAKQVGLPGFNYAEASRIWKDGNLGSLGANADTIAALAAVTWEGESSFELKPTNQPNINQQGVTWSVDYGPFMINPYFHHSANGSVLGTNGADERSNGNPDANIAFGISILEGLYKTYTNNAAGRYVGSLGYDSNGNPTSGQERENTWNQFKSSLAAFFGNKLCFP